MRGRRPGPDRRGHEGVAARTSGRGPPHSPAQDAVFEHCTNWVSAMSMLPSPIRPAWLAEIPVPASSPAIDACVHAVVPSGGAEVAVATIASRTPGPYTSGRPQEC